MKINPDAAAFAVSLAINLILIGSPIAAGVTLAFKLTRAAPPRLRYLIAVLAFAASALLPVAATWRASRLSPPELVGDRGVKEDGSRDARVGAGQGSLNEVRSSDPTLLRGGQSPSAEESSTPARARLSTLLNSSAMFLARGRLAVYFSVVWLLVALALLGREMLGHVRLSRMRRSWRPADGSIRKALGWPDNMPLYIDDAEGPCAVGFLRPAVVIPERLLAELSPASARRILLHERDHARWRDPLLNALLRALRAALWPGVPLWLLERAARIERESAADFAAVSGLEGRRRSEKAATEYATSLVQIARWSAGRAWRRRHSAVVTEVGDRLYLEERVRRLLAAPSALTAGRISLAGVFLLAGVTLTTFLPVAALPLNSLRPTAEGAAAEGGRGGASTAVAGESPSARPAGRIPYNGALETPGGDSALGTSFTEIRPRQHTQDTSESLTTTALEESGGLVEGVPAKIEAGLAAGQDAQAPEQSTPQNFQQSTPQNFQAGPDFFRDGMASVGYPNLSGEELAALKKSDVSPLYVRELAAAGYVGLPVNTLIRLRGNSVSAAYISEMRRFGYDNLSPEQLCDFRWHSVTAAYIREMAALGYDNLSAKMIVAFRRNSVTPAYVNEMRSAVKGDISGDEMIGLSWTGVTRRFIDGLRALGYGHLTADQLISMRRHGVTLAFVEKMRGRNSGNLSADDLIALRRDGVN